MREYTPTDEQIEALCAADFAADSSDLTWDDCAIKDAWRDDMRALTSTAAFQSMIRAAQAEALREFAESVPPFTTDRASRPSIQDVLRNRADQIESGDTND